MADRIRRALTDRTDVAEKKMFGGLCFMVRGHMCCGIDGERLMLRVGADRYAEALRRPHAREMDFTGRPLKGFVFVAREGFKTARQLESWLSLATANVEQLPPKPAAKRKMRKGRK